MRPLGDVLATKRLATANELAAIGEVHDLATEYSRLSPADRPAFLSEVRRLANGRQCWLATRFTPPGHDMFRPLMALLDGLIAAQGIIQTRQGAIDPEAFIAAEGRIELDEGHELLVFPVRYPWRRKPDEKTGEGGDRMPAAFRPRSERHPVVGSFGVGVRQAEPTDRPRDWWEDQP